MSFSLTITRDADGVRLQPVDDLALQHIPVGTITVSGHTVKPGESGTEFAQVSIKHEDGYYFGANGNTARDRRGAAAPATGD